MNEITITLPKLHKSQQEVYNNAKRFTVVCCGRRWGKSTMSKSLIARAALNGVPVAYFAPTYKMSTNYFREMKEMLNPVIKSKLEQEKRIELITGGTIDFWSLDSLDSVRGRFYKLVVIDEAAITPSTYLKEAWENAIRPLLTDLKGDAWFLSTPKGKKHYYKSLADNSLKDESWAFFKKPTIDNPFIDISEVEEARKLLPPVVFAQEYEAEFTDKMSDNLFIHSFNRERHLAKEEIFLDNKLPIVISIDINVSPLCAIVAQVDTLRWSKIHIIDEYRRHNSDIYELCNWIKSKYDTRKLIITGDSSGFNRSANSLGHKSTYDIVQSELRLNWSQIKTLRGKPAGYVEDKRILGNALFAKHDNLLLSNTPYLVEDLENVSATDSGHMDKQGNPDLTHLLDALLDFFYSICKNSVKIPLRNQ